MIRILLFFCIFYGISAKIPVNVINLEKDRVRWDNVSEQLKKAGVRTVERLPAVNGKLLQEHELHERATGIARIFATRGMIGCYLSHYNFWLKVSQGSSPFQLVLEDDVVLEDNFYSNLEKAVAEIESCHITKDSWDVLMVGALGCVDPSGRYGLNRMHAFVAGGGRKTSKITPHCHIPRRPFGTHAYLLHKRGAAKLLKQATLAAGHVDAVAWGLSSLNLFAIHPMLAFQAFEAPSTIGAVVDGVERRLPNFVVDKYTRATFKWAFNEPVIQLPGLQIILSVGRALILGLFGIFLGLIFHKDIPLLLPIHCSVIVITFLFLRIMVRPVGERF